LAELLEGEQVDELELREMARRQRLLKATSLKREITDALRDFPKERVPDPEPLEVFDGFSSIASSEGEFELEEVVLKTEESDLGGSEPEDVEYPSERYIRSSEWNDYTVQLKATLRGETKQARSNEELMQLKRREERDVLVAKLEESMSVDLRNIAYGGGSTYALENAREALQLFKERYEAHLQPDDAEGCEPEDVALILNACMIEQFRVRAAIAVMLKPDIKLTSVSLANNSLDLNCTKMMVPALKLVLPTLTRLDLSDNINFDNKTASMLARILDPRGKSVLQRARIKSLSLSGCPILDAGARVIAGSLTFNRTLRVLSLARCGIGDVGGVYLGKMLQENATLHELDISWNSVSVSGARSLATGMKFNNSLRELNLGYNAVGDVGGGHLGEMIRENAALGVLHLERNNLGPVACMVIGEGVSQNHTMRELYCDDNPTCAEGAVHLLEALGRNTTLHRLGLLRCTFVLAPTGSRPGQNTLSLGFDRLHPDKHYKLHLDHPIERHVATELVTLWKSHGPASWNNTVLNGKNFTLTTEADWPHGMPEEGVLELDFRSVHLIAVDRSPMRDNVYQCMLSNMQHREAHDWWRLAFVGVLTVRSFFTTAQVHGLIETMSHSAERIKAAVMLFGRVTDQDAFSTVLASFGAREREDVEEQLGALATFHPDNPTGQYTLNLSRALDRIVARRLIELSVAEGLYVQDAFKINWHNASLDQQRISRETILAIEKFQLPTTGMLVLDFVSHRRINARSGLVLERMRKDASALIRSRTPTPGLDDDDGGGNVLFAPDSHYGFTRCLVEVKTLVDAYVDLKNKTAMALKRGLEAPTPPKRTLRNKLISAMRSCANKQYVSSAEVVRLVHVLRAGGSVGTGAAEAPKYRHCVEVAVIFFARLTDEGFSNVHRALTPEEQVAVGKRLGWANVTDMQHPENIHYKLRLTDPAEHHVAHMLCRMAMRITECHDCLANFLIDGKPSLVKEDSKLWATITNMVTLDPAKGMYGTLEFDMFVPETARLEAAARLVQAHFRGMRERRRMQHEKQTNLAVKFIQRVTRGWLTRRRMRPLLRRRKMQAATKMVALHASIKRDQRLQTMRDHQKQKLNINS